MEGWPICVQYFGHAAEGERCSLPRGVVGEGPEDRYWIARAAILDPGLIRDFHSAHPEVLNRPRGRGPGGGGCTVVGEGATSTGGSCAPRGRVGRRSLKEDGVMSLWEICYDCA